MSDKYAALKQAAEKAKLESKDEWGYDTDAFHDEATPETILELLAERDADKRRIEELEAANALNKHLELAIRKAEGCSEALRRRAETAEQRIAELEARTLTVKLPPEVQGSNIPFAADGANAMRKEVINALTEACAAAGISLKIEGE